MSLDPDTIVVSVLVFSLALVGLLAFVATEDRQKRRLYREAERAARDRLRADEVQSADGGAPSRSSDPRQFDPTDPGTKVGYKPDWARPEGD